jgi:TPR repeat protein
MKTHTRKEAFEDAREGAKAGVPRYQNFVGYCYDMGRGVRRNLKMARYWYEKASRNGRLDAIFNLAVMNDQRHGMKRNAARAARLYRQAAERGDIQSQNNLAGMLLDGDGVKKDTVNGLRWLRRAAQRGDTKAQYNLGRAYLHGSDGVRLRQ